MELDGNGVGLTGPVAKSRLSEFRVRWLPIQLTIPSDPTWFVA
jgi:hypothetical protein